MRAKCVYENLNESANTDKKGFAGDIEGLTLKNQNFRKVLYTAKNLQLVLMSVKPGEQLGEEVHHSSDQFFRIEGGNGECVINGNVYKIKNGDCIIVPQGAKHNVINKGKSDLKFYTIYAEPHHQDGVTYRNKKEAESAKEKFEGKTTE